MSSKTEKAKFQLPAAEDDLWEQVVTALLRQRDAELQARDHLRLLEELAFHKQFCHRALSPSFVLNTAIWLAEEMKLEGPGDKARKWLEDLQAWELLWSGSDGSDTTYEFPIPGLDEYFAACHLAARWREDDERYRKWLPCMEGWWEKGEELICPNPRCEFRLPPFRDLINRAEYEETLILMVGLLNMADREEMFLKGMKGDFNFNLKALGRCRYIHTDIAENVKDSIWAVCRERLWWPATGLERGLPALGRARVQDNIHPLLGRCVDALQSQTATDRGAAAALDSVGDRVVELFIAGLRDSYMRPATLEDLKRLADRYGLELKQLLAALSDEEDRRAAFRILGCMGGPAIQPLIDALKDEYWKVRRAAVEALGRLGDTGATAAIEALVVDPDEDVRRAARSALQATESRNRPQSV